MTCETCCTITCVHCGASKRVKPYSVRTARYCSRVCKSKAESSFIFTKDAIDFIRSNFPFELSTKRIASELRAPLSSVTRMIAKLDLEACPTSLRNARSGQSRLVWTKERIIRDIKALHRMGQANSAAVQRTQGALHVSACAHFGSWGAAVEAAGIPYAEVNLYASRRTWDCEQIIAEIHRMHAAGLSLRAGDARYHHAAVFNAARREPSLGSWEAAIAAAGFDYNSIRGGLYGSVYHGTDGYRYNSRVEGLVGERLHDLEVREVIARVNRQVRVTRGRAWRCDFVVETTDGQQLWIEVDGLGSARKDPNYEAKIEHYRTRRMNYVIVRTPGQAEQAIRNGRRGKITTDRDSPRKITELGENRYTDEELVDEVRRVCKRLKRTPTCAEFSALARVTISTVRRRIGWNETLIKLGYRPTRAAPRALLLQDLRRVISEYGHTPTMVEFNERSQYKATVLSARFGSWTAALRAAGSPPTHERWTDERIIRTLRLLDANLPRMTLGALASSGYRSLCHVVQRRFGGLARALAAAGIDAHERMVGWSRRHDACVTCGSSDRPHTSRGRCARCYNREVARRRT